MAYRAMCKCRLCGEVFANGAVTGNKGLAVQAIVDMSLNRYTVIQAPHSIQTHLCENGDVGCADFIGWKVGE